MPLNLKNLYHSDGKKLGSLFAGQSGSGKTVAVISTLRGAILSPEFGEYHRFIIIDPKRQGGDYDMLADPTGDLDKLFKSIKEERVSLFYPDLEYIEEQVSAIVDYVFDLSDMEPKSTYTLVLDEASILITSTRIPLSLQRLAVQGRAKRIIPIWISQRPIVNRWTDANLSNMFLFRTLQVDADNLSKRWGIDFSSASQIIAEKPYSFIWFDLEKLQTHNMEPVPLPKRLPRPKKKRGRFTQFFRDLI